MSYWVSCCVGVALAGTAPGQHVLWTVAGSSNQAFAVSEPSGEACVAIGDANGDGFADLVV